MKHHWLIIPFLFLALTACSAEKKQRAEAEPATEPTEETQATDDQEQQMTGQTSTSSKDDMSAATAMTKQMQTKMTPDAVIERLKAGNERFVNNEMVNRDLNEQVQASSGGQYPYAVVLSCIDSRVPPEIVFDQGIGDIFATRTAGHVVDDHVLGSLEFGTKVAGSKVIVVMGHTSCGAVKGSCDDVDLGHINSLVTSIQPSVKAVTPEDKTCSSKNTELVNNIASHHVDETIKKLREESDILRQLENEGSIKIVGAMYDVADGAVSFR